MAAVMKKLFFIVLFGMAFTALILSVVNFAASRNSTENTAPSIEVNLPSTVATTLTDSAIRSWLDVCYLVANYTLPEDAHFFYVTWLEFEDGKLVNEKLTLVVSMGLWMDVKPNEPVSEKILGNLNDYYDFYDKSILHIELLWSADIHKILFTAAGGTTKQVNDFWMHLSDRIISSHIEPDPYHGYTILGFAASRLNRNGEEADAENIHFPQILDEKKDVGVLAIKTFATEEALRQDLETIHKSWDNL